MKSILVFRPAALGDFVMSSPALREVRKNFPERHVVLLTVPSITKDQRVRVSKYTGDRLSVPWLELVMPHLVDEFFILDSVTHLGFLWNLRRKLRSFHFEAVILMIDSGAKWQGRIKKVLLMFFLVGFVPVLGWRGPGTLTGNRVGLKKRGLLRHHVHGPLHFLAELNPPKIYKDEDLVFDLRPGQVAEEWVSDWLVENKKESKRLVAIAPGSIQPHKRWPEQSFMELISRLLAAYPDVAIVVLGTPDDKGLGETLMTISSKRIFNLAGVTSIVQSAALLRKCALLVGNDGGAAHLADAMGCQVVSIIPGIEYPDSVEPWHNKALAVRYPVSCAPCYNFIFCPEKHNNCMKDLPVNLVLENCKKVLG